MLIRSHLSQPFGFNFRAFLQLLGGSPTSLTWPAKPCPVTSSLATPCYVKIVLATVVPSHLLSKKNLIPPGDVDTCCSSPRKLSVPLPGTLLLIFWDPP